MKREFEFQLYNKTVLKKMEKLIQSLNPTPEKIIRKHFRYKDESYLLKDKSDLFKHIAEDIAYQTDMAKKIIARAKATPEAIPFSSFSWECTLEEFDLSNFLSVCVVLKTNNPSYGRLRYPIDMLLRADNSYQYWETICVEDAIKAIEDLEQELN